MGYKRKFHIRKGKIVDVQYERGDFCCSGKKLISLEGCPEKIEKNFDCSDNQLTSLVGGPKEVGGDFYCSNNQLTSLEGCPKNGIDYLNCGYNLNLEDISDISPACKRIVITNCCKIIKFPEKIEDTLMFIYTTSEVRQRIKEIPFYEIVDEDAAYIVVRQKNIGAQLLDEL